VVEVAGARGIKVFTFDNGTTPAKLVSAINRVTTLRGVLGAIQRATLETTVAGINETLVNLTEAQSDIRDTDFAEETSRLTQAQILVQSGSSVLQI